MMKRVSQPLGSQKMQLKMIDPPSERQNSNLLIVLTKSHKNSKKTTSRDVDSNTMLMSQARRIVHEK